MYTVRKSLKFPRIPVRNLALAYSREFPKLGCLVLSNVVLFTFVQRMPDKPDRQLDIGYTFELDTLCM